MAIFQDLSFLQIFVWIAGGLFVLSVGRIISLGRQNRRIASDHARMENWASVQLTELAGVHQDAQSWRAKTQQQFDATRRDLGTRLEQTERCCAHAYQQVEAAYENALAAAMAQIQELEGKLTAASKASAAAASAMPALPAMEPLRGEDSLQARLAAVKAEAEAQRLQKGRLQRALLAARRKHSPARRPGMRVPRLG